MLLVYWRLDGDDPEELDRAVSGYRVVLEEWSDGLNRRLALVATYFGPNWSKNSMCCMRSTARPGSCSRKRSESGAMAAH